VPTGERSRSVAGGVFANVGAAGLDPDRVVHDAVDDGVGVDVGAKALGPVLACWVQNAVEVLS
jgi:hypothetical protein